MSTNISPNFGTNYLPGAMGAGSLSIALIGPDPGKRHNVAAALAEDGRTIVSEFETYPRRPDEFHWLVEQSFDVIVLDLDSDPDVVLELVGKISAAEAATVMVYSAQADTRLAVRYMRAGAREYLLLPLEDGVVAEALDRAVTAHTEKTHPARQTAGKLFVFVCAKGGCGATTLACNLAIALAANSDQKTLLIDLALPIGDAALALGITAQYSTEDAIRSVDRLDGSLLSELLVKHRSGLFVLPAPSNFPGIEGCEDAIEKLIAIARRQFDHVVVDVGSRIDLMETSVFRQASTVYLVTLSGVSELRNSNRLISQFFPAGGPNLEVVINRFENRLLGGVKEDDIAKALGAPVRWTAPEDREAALEMQYGETGAASTRIARLGLEMAAAITGRAVPDEKKKEVRLRAPRRSAPEEQSDDAAPAQTRIAPPAPEPVTPVIDWEPPAAICYGEELSPAQLNATTPVAGTFVYSPAPGTVLPAGTHQLSVSFVPEDSENYTAAEATVSLEVEKAMPAISWPCPEPIPYGTLLGDAQLDASASVAGDFEYSAAHGELLDAGPHSLSVKFTPSDSENYLPVEAEALLVVEKVAPEIAWSSPEPITYGTRLGDSHLCASASVPGRFEYSEAPGALLPAGVHTLSARFTPSDTDNYATVEVSIELVVDKAVPIVEWPSPDPIPNGTELNEKQLCAAASVLGRFEYAPGLGAVLPAGTHTLSVTFVPADAENYAEVEAAVPLHVARATPVVEWSNPHPIRYGAKLSAKQLCATASVQGRFQYTPAIGEVLAAGTHTLSAMFVPSDSVNYAPVRAAVSLEVAKAIPGIEWPAPRTIPRDTPLNEQHLCASSPQPGTFEYTPALGKVLPAGTHMLSVTFTPVDAANYATTHAAVSVKVVDKPAAAFSSSNPYPRVAPGTRNPSSGFGPAKSDVRNGVPQSAETEAPYSDRPAPDSIRGGKPLRAIEPEPSPVLSAKSYASLARAEIPAPEMDLRPATAPPSEFERPWLAQAMAAPRIEREAAISPAARAERLAELDPEQHLQPSAVASQAPDPLDWLMAPGAMRSETESSGYRIAAKKKWIAISAGAASLLLAGVFLVPALHSRAKSPLTTEVAPPPAASNPVASADTPKPSPAKTVATPPAPQDATSATSDTSDTSATDSSADSAPDQAKPSAVQTELMRDQLNAQARIPQVQKQAAANAPPPANFSPAEAGGMGGNAALGNVFSGKAPAVVAAAPHGPVAIPTDAAMRLLTQKTLPEYPLIARQAHVSGTVQLEVTISKEGKVEDLHAVSGNPMLRMAAADAVRVWRFRPYLINNQPVEFNTVINVGFALER